ncbi:MAG: 2OG-Fe(II) oxygenase [Pseudomonadota bacterium]
MSSPVLPMDPVTLSLDISAAKAAAEKVAAAYQSADPFPHASFDNFLPSEILDRVLEELEELPAAERSFNRDQERFKASYNPERLQPYTRALFHSLNSPAFLLFLEKMSGIPGLISDPYFIGGGIHVVGNGGHLDIHADFNQHNKLKIERRLNVLIYLNKDWREEYGGSFELWNEGMREKTASFVPTFNRMCCFSTTSDSWHGNPDPVKHPDGEPRRSIALYYYTATWTDEKKEHTTLFRPRPNTDDKRDWSVARHQFVRDLIPPMLYRRIAGPLRRIGL